MKRLATLLTLVLLLALIPLAQLPTASAAGVAATRIASKVTVDGVVEAFDAYTINGNNYFKLRDIASALTGTDKQFEVAWDSEKDAISLYSGKPYTSVGDERSASSGSRMKSASLSTSSIYLDGRAIPVTAYQIDGSNYFKLRDLGSALDFYVDWNSRSNTIEIESTFRYVAEGSGDTYSYIGNILVGDTQKNVVSNWASISPIQQFAYLDEGLAYAYVKDNRLALVTPSKTYSLEMKYPLLGDVTADAEGNFYVVWGKEGTVNTDQTMFISKFAPTSEHLKTIGFVGGSVMGEDGNTKIPFDAGNCVSTIRDGTLMVNYAREMYNGHQSNNVIAVNVADLSPYKFDPLIWDNSQDQVPYVSHSFNQAVIYSEKAEDFIFANHGDAYGRGFIIDKLHKGMYPDYQKRVYASTFPTLNLFHFYLEANANYNMWTVNKTFAQLGGLAETSKGVVLVGASAKSISEAAKTEKQNLFVQIFDPIAKELSASAFVGGTARSGETSFDINDNKNSPLTPVTDYGVNWLTDYTDRDVIAPQVVVADDRIVILWTENEKNRPVSRYMVLSAGGDVLTPATSLRSSVKLNSYEMPIYHDGLVTWAYTYNGKLRVASINP